MIIAYYKIVKQSIHYMHGFTSPVIVLPKKE